MNGSTEIVPTQEITRVIRLLRDQRVILDSDLALLYAVPTKRLNEQYRRNKHRFPQDFAFQLSGEEWAGLRSQNATLKPSSVKEDSIPYRTRKPTRGRHFLLKA